MLILGLCFFVRCLLIDFVYLSSAIAVTQFLRKKLSTQEREVKKG